jgi:hypothetical protein
VLHLNDIQGGLNSTIRRFADNAIIFIAVKSTIVAEHLQQDLSKTLQFGTEKGKWLFIQTNVSYCVSLEIKFDKI